MLTRMQRKGNLCTLLIGTAVGIDTWKTVGGSSKKLKIEP